MQIHRHADIGSFVARGMDWLLRNEAENNELISVAQLLLEKDNPFHPPVFVATIEHEGRVVGCAMRPPPDPLMLSALPPAAMVPLVEELRTVYDDLPAVIGPADAATRFARQWVGATGGDWRAALECRWYSLSRVVWPNEPPAGKIRLAVETDKPFLRSWAKDYGRAVDTDVDVFDFFSRRIAKRALHLWDDGGPRCVVAVSGLTPNGARISAVYTPAEYRRRGYASAAVATVSDALVRRGVRFCLLFADAHSRATCSVYERVGYRYFRDSVALRFAT